MRTNFCAILFLLFINSTVFSQTDKMDQKKINGTFYKISLATTLHINEDWTSDTNDDEPLIIPNGFFFNNTVGFQFDERSSISLNFEYDFYSKQALHFFPAFLEFKYNIIHFEDVFDEGTIYQSNVFIRGGYGTLLSMGKSFEKGNFLRLGIGYQAQIDDSNNSILFGLDFTRKRFGFETLEGLSSLSIFLEFMVF